jgi:hypothetical protein
MTAAAESQPLVFLAVPTYDGRLDNGTFKAILAASRRRIIVAENNASLLAYNFNALYCMALNLRKTMGVTHFCMLHGDVAPAGDWLNAMLDEMAATGAEALSAVIPIKNTLGITSTALDLSGDGNVNPWNVRRLTIKEIARMPQTFDGRQAAAVLTHWDAARLPVLLINTGLLLIDLGAPWAERVLFTIEDRIVRDENGDFRAFVNSEDWNLSRQLHRMGARYFATRRVAVLHSGRHDYSNCGDWGSDVDPAVFGNGVVDEPVQIAQGES